MYIKLGSINLQYYQETNDWIILGEILDSGMSYEKPILVRTTEELDIWFGNNYKDYSYMQELINMGVVLYLYKPVSNKTTGDIDLDSYTENDDIKLRDVELEWVSKVIKDPEKYKFQYDNGTTIKIVGLKVNSSGGLSVVNNPGDREFCTDEIARKELLTPINCFSEIYKNQIKFQVYNSDHLWIYYDGKIVDTKLLPQNINLTSISGNNRDTLVVSSPEDDLEFTYLDYNYETDEFGIFQYADLIEGLSDISEEYKSEIDMEKVATEYQTLMFKIEGDTIGSNDYFVIPDTIHGMDPNNWRIYYRTLDEVPEDVKNKFSLKTKISSRSNFVTRLRDYGGYTVKTWNEGIYIYSTTIIPITNFYNSSTIKLIPETRITELILSNYIKKPGIMAVSKTIGRSSEFEDDLIKFTLERQGSSNYRATISRYSYSEIFDGTIEPKPGEQRLDNLISQQSKLIRCDFHFYEDDETKELRTGTYYLRGATKEEETPEMYKYSLKQMLSTEYNIPVYPDYFLIPDKYKYTSNIETEDIFSPFLEYSKEIGCQFLIENKSYSEFGVITVINTLPSILEKYKYYKVRNYYDWLRNHIEDPTTISKESKIITVTELPEITKEGIYYLIETYYDWNGNETIGDYIYNLTKDPENRLIYFFKPMTYKYQERPGYYAYLRGLLLDEYSISVKDILYRTPTQDAFLVDSIEEILKTYKSNYLVCDNQTYFYKEYQDGESYITTGWTRFIAGKIFRELQKNSGNILGQQLLGKVRSEITNLITSISSGFSIVRTIGMTEFEPGNNGQYLKIVLNTVMNDLVKNNVNLDITVNYNNNITYGTIS